MELQEIKPRNLRDEIEESMSEAEAEMIPGPELISEHESESIYENPYSTRIYHDFGGSRIIRNFDGDQSTDETIFQKIEQRKWYLLCLMLGLLTGVMVGGLSMHFTKTPANARVPTTISGESNSRLLNINYKTLCFVSH